MTWKEAKDKARPCPNGPGCDGYCDLCGGHHRLVSVRCDGCGKLTEVVHADMWCECDGNWLADGYEPTPEPATDAR